MLSSITVMPRRAEPGDGGGSEEMLDDMALLDVTGLSGMPGLPEAHEDPHALVT
jgi:hypothetical protein